MSISSQDTEQRLLAVRKAGGLRSIKTLLQLSGPGFLLSTLTLNASSLASSMFLGLIGVYEMLWVQLLSMVLGVFMWGAISYATLSIKSSPFEGIRKHINLVLAWSWLGATLSVTMMWSLPQYSTAYAAVTNNLFPGIQSDKFPLGPVTLVSLLLLVILEHWYRIRHVSQERLAT